MYREAMPIPHQEMRRIIRRRIHGTEGAERIRLLETLLGELPGYQTGPYGELRKWVHQQIDAAGVRRAAKHRDALHVPKEGCAQVVLVGPANAGKSTLLRALTGRPVAVGAYRFTTLRPAAGVVSVGGAPVQLVDLPGLVVGAREGAGGGRLLLACVRAADAVLYCLPTEPEAQASACPAGPPLRRRAWRPTRTVVGGGSGTRRVCALGRRVSRPQDSPCILGGVSERPDRQPLDDCPDCGRPLALVLEVLGGPDAPGGGAFRYCTACGELYARAGGDRRRLARRGYRMLAREVLRLRALVPPAQREARSSRRPGAEGGDSALPQNIGEATQQARRRRGEEDTAPGR